MCTEGSISGEGEKEEGGVTNHNSLCNGFSLWFQLYHQETVTMLCVANQPVVSQHKLIRDDHSLRVA